jgi:methylated-DNA-[protein]-cysteine S-methyltransferase
MRAVYEIFETGHGWVGLAATDRGLVGSVLPVETRESVERKLIFSRETFDRLIPPPEDAIRLLSAYYQAEPVDLSRCKLDLTGVAPFDRKVYEIIVDIARGAVLTYGETARRAGRPGAARAVGGAMSRNPLPPFIPCHRVVGSGGRMVGFSTEGGVKLKCRLLEMEGATLRGDRVIV